MQTTISARHCEVTESLQERALAVTERLAQLSPHALEATVVFDEGPLAHTVEIRLHARGRKVLIGAYEIGAAGCRVETLSEESFLIDEIFTDDEDACAGRR